jgi:hypothetical protein
MNTQEIALAISIANFALTWGVAIYVHLGNKDKATNQRIGTFEESVSETLTKHATQLTALEAAAGDCSQSREKCPVHAERIAHLETGLKSAPSHADLARIYESVNDLARTVNQLVGVNQGQSDALRMILNKITEKGLA